MRQASKWPVSPLSVLWWSMLKAILSNRSLQCITACPSLSPQWSGIKTEYISCSIATIRMRQASKLPVSPLSILWLSMWKAILFKSVATMHNGMSKFKSPMIRNQKLSISLAVLRRFECSQASKLPVSPLSLLWLSMLKAILFKSVATMHNGMSKFKSPMIRNQNWVYLLQYCHHWNAPSIKIARFTLVHIVAIYVESDSVQIGRYNA